MTTPPTRLRPPASAPATGSARLGPLGRRQWCLGTSAWPGLGGCATRPPAAPTLATAGGVLLPFSGDPHRAGLPAGWHARQLRPDLPRTRHPLAERDGRRVLPAVANASISGLRCAVDSDPRHQPWLHWDWRVDDPPPKPPWPTMPARTARPGCWWRLTATRPCCHCATACSSTSWRCSPAGCCPLPRWCRCGTARRGPKACCAIRAAAGRWTHDRRDLVDGYRRVCGSQPGRSRSVGVATDSDDLKGHSEAGYGDLRFDSL